MRTEQPPTVLAGRYALELQLGTSGTGTSWSATDTVLERRVVVKIISKELTSEPAFAERLDLELRMVALVSHRGLARLLDTGKDDGIAFIVRELIEGDSARTLIARNDTVPVEQGAVVRGALDAIAAAHEAGVLHLDLKPENVFQCMDGTIRVTDLGFGEAVISSIPPPEAMEILQPAPMAPEAVAGASLDGRADVWAAGALLYELLIGRAPEAGDVSPRDRRSDVSRKLDDVVRRALSPEPDDRFATASEFGSALGHAAGAATGRVALPARRSRPEETAVVAPAPAAPPRPSIFRTWFAVPLLVVVIGAIALGAGLWLGRLELGGPVGIRFGPTEESPASAARVLVFKSVAAVDPYGDEQENDSGLPLAADGDPLTVWKSENYFDGTLNKAGVGILFDFETRRTVTGFRLQTPYPEYRFAVVVGNDLPAMIASARPTFTAADDMRDSIEPATGRYVLLWITTVVPTDDGHRAEVGEFEVVGPA
jgi:tRNA A-37 threonylcarbamoyl transferase component Bud32